MRQGELTEGKEEKVRRGDSRKEGRMGMEKVGKWRKGRRKKEIKKGEQIGKGKGIRNITSLILFRSLLSQITYSIDTFVL